MSECAVKMQLATLCYVRDKGKTLMVHRIAKKEDIHANKWNGLGGKFESGETPEECVKREVYEESGLIITNPALKGVLTFPRFSHEVDWYVFLFIAIEFVGQLVDSPEGKLEWIHDDHIPSLNLWEGDVIFLRWLNENKFFSGKFEYKNRRLSNHHVVFY